MNESEKRKQQINELTGQYTSRGPFSYDPAADAGYQSYVNMMKSNGEAAMRDTMAKAASLTGGYGNSYAVAAAQGAYNDYLRQADAAQGEFYDRALAAYNAEGNELLNKIGLLQEQDDAAYNRFWSENERDYERLWNENERDYQRGQDDYNKLWNEASAKMELGDVSAMAELLGMKEIDVKTALGYGALGESELEGFKNALINGKGDDYLQKLAYSGYDTSGLVAQAQLWAMDGTIPGGYVGGYSDGKNQHIEYEADDQTELLYQRYLNKYGQSEDFSDFILKAGCFK